jgi:hypothetical protein
MSVDLVARARTEKWHRGDLTHLLHKGQKLINKAYTESIRQLFVCNISRQWGKSYFAVTKSVELALKNPKSRIKYGTAFHTDLTQFILPAFEAVLAGCPAELKPKYKAQGSKFVFPNGSEIKLCGLDKNPNSLRGNQIDLIVIDEAAFVDNLDYVYKSVIMPATLHRPNCKILFISTPPSTPAHPFMDFVQKAELEGNYIKLTIYDNPIITEKDIERMANELGGKDSTTFRREMLCEFITDADLAIIPEWKEEYVADFPKDEYYNFYHKYSAMDLGVKDFTALIFGYYDFKRATLVIEDEMMMHGPSMNTIKLVDAIKTKEQEVWEGQPPFRRISDNNNLHLLQDLSSIHDLHFVSTNKDTLEAMINEVRIMVQSGQLIIHPRCKQLAGCLKYGVWNQKKNSFARSSTYGHYDHLAALIYLVRNLAKHSNPIPMDHGFQNHTAWLGNIREANETTKTGNELKKALFPNMKRTKIPIT